MVTAGFCQTNFSSSSYPSPWWNGKMSSKVHVSPSPQMQIRQAATYRHLKLKQCSSLNRGNFFFFNVALPADRLAVVKDRNWKKLSLRQTNRADSQKVRSYPKIKDNYPWIQYSMHHTDNSSQSKVSLFLAIDVLLKNLIFNTTDWQQFSKWSWLVLGFWCFTEEFNIPCYTLATILKVKLVLGL